MGLTFGNQVNATGTGSGTPVTIVLELVAAAIFLGCDGHHVFLGVMHNTFVNYPVGGGLPTLPMQEMVAGATATEEWGLMLAAPVAVCLFLTTVVLMLLGRTTPQLNLYSIGFSLRLGVGLVAVLPSCRTAWTRWSVSSDT
jgi:flagellar biosynthetic protein FliR